MGQRVLMTGMSGTGKSSIIQTLSAMGYCTVDMDWPGWSTYDAAGEWVWRASRVRALLERLGPDQNLALCGCASNQGQFYADFDVVVLLSAPVAVIAERLATRTTNIYGKTAAELAATLANLQEIEPRLRLRADLEIDTRQPLAAVVTQIARLLDQPRECLQTASPPPCADTFRPIQEQSHE